MKKILFFFFFLTVFTYAFGHEGNHANYKIRRISPDGGLGTNGQRDVRQDKWGFIWIITVNNLYRFDGYTFKFYTDKLKKPDSPIVWSFERLEIDGKGDIYVTTNYGLLKYNPLTDNFDHLFQGSVNLLKEDAKGRLWMSDVSTVGLFDSNTLEFHSVESDEGVIQGISAIHTRNEQIFVGTSSGYIYLYEENERKFHKVFEQPQNNIVDMASADSLLYVLTENKGLMAINLSDFKEIKRYDFFYPEGDRRVPARALFIDKTGHIWITSQRGIHVVHPQSDHYIHYCYDKTESYGLPSSSVWRISEDNQGNLWFGTYSGGLCLVNLDEQKKFKSFNGLTDDLSYSVVSCFEEDNDYLWIGTEGGGLNRYDKMKNEFTSYTHDSSPNSISYDNIQSLLFTADDHLWIGMSRGGLDRMNTRTGQFTHFRVNNGMLLNDHVERIVAEGDSGIWIKYLMDRDNLTYLSLKNNKPEHLNFKSPTIQFNGNISDIQRGNGDTLWIASSYQLLMMDVSTRKVSEVPYSFSEVANYSTINILTLFVDKEKNCIWIGTNGSGLLMYDIASRSLSQKADLSKYNVHLIYSINKDNRGNLWMGTNNGLFCMDKSNERLLQYGKSDGTQGQTYYPFSTFKSVSGKLYFGGNEGFTVIDTVQNEYNSYKPDVIITDFLLDNQSVIPGIENSPLQSSIFQTKELTLDYNQNNFAFEFTSTNYINSDKNRFRYRLKGYEDRWIESDANHRTISYAKVPRGWYTFEIITANNDGVWGEPTRLQLTIRPAPWFNSLAIAGYIGFLIFIFYLVLRYYNYQRKLKLQVYLEEQEKKQKEEYHQSQLMFFTNVSHDFRTPLSLILAALEPVKMGDKNGKYLSILENNAKRLLALVNELMDFRSLQNKKVNLFLQKGDWNSFVAGHCSDFSEYAKQKNIRFSMMFDASISKDLYFDCKIMEKILLNLLNNAFKYTPEGGMIEVVTFADVTDFRSLYNDHLIIRSMESNENIYGLVIKDSGIGISESSINRIFERYYRINESTGSQHLGSGIGLALVKSLVELHKGNIAVYSERGKGSDIVIGFPVERSVYSEENFKEDNYNFHLPQKLPIDIPDEMALENLPANDCLSDCNKTILLAEDNDELRELLAEMLIPYYMVRKVHNGLEALKSMEEEEVDLIISDIMMPEMDGIALSQKVKNNMETSHIPIVLLTAKTGAENQIQGLNSGANAYLEKPVNKQVLLLTIVNLFNQQAKTREFYAKHYFASPSMEAPGNRKDEEFMTRLINLIEENLANTEIDVSQMASSLAMSRRTLYGKVKTLTGQSVVEFIRNYRLRKSAQILVEKNIPISQVMERVGIDNASYFSRIFKKEFGVSPSEFVARHHDIK